ncbi:MAG: GAF domain-containing protein, partial [Anaerolineae bacterium]
MDQLVNGLDSLNEGVLRPLLHNLLAAMGGVLWAADEDGRFCYIAPQIEDLLGYPAASWLENPNFWHTCLHPDDRAWVVDHFHSHLTNERPYQIEYRALTKNGRLAWIHDIAVPTNDPEIPVIGVKHNITEEKTRVLLHQFARNVGSTLSRREILRISLRQLKHVFVFDSGSIYLKLPADHIEFIAGIGFADTEVTARAAQNLLDKSPILAQMSHDLQPVISRDVRQLPGWIWIPGADHVRSFLAVPLISRGQMIGALMVDSRKTNYFKTRDLQIIETLAQHIAVSIENARLFEEAQQQLRLAQTLQQVGSLLTTSLGLNEVYERIFDLLAKVVSYDSVSIQLTNYEGNAVSLVAGRGFPDLEMARDIVDNMGKPALSKFSGQTAVIVIADTWNDDQWIREPAGNHIRSWIGALLQVKGETIGVLNVDASQPNAFTDADGRLVAAFANQAAVAIANARLYEEMRLRADELTVLHRVAMATAATVDVDELLHIATKTIANSLYPETFGFVLVDEETGIMTPHPSYHGIKEELYDIIIPTKSVTGRVVQSGKTFKSGDVSHEEIFFSAVSGTQSELAVPFKVKEKVVGVINVESSRPNAFTDNDARFLNTLAAQVALAVERAGLYRELQLHAADLAEQVAARTAELKVERDRTLEILESAGEGILMTDKDVQILYVNPALEQQCGYSRQELLGRTPSLLRAEDTPQAIIEEMQAAISAGSRWAGEFVNR